MKNKALPGSQCWSQRWVNASERQGLRTGTDTTFWKHEFNLLFLCMLLEPAAAHHTQQKRTSLPEPGPRIAHTHEDNEHCCHHTAAHSPNRRVSAAVGSAGRRCPSCRCLQAHTHWYCGANTWAMLGACMKHHGWISASSWLVRTACAAPTHLLWAVDSDAANEEVLL